jgi:hypothetical protein
VISDLGRGKRRRQLIERLFDELERELDAVAAAREPERA